MNEYMAMLAYVRTPGGTCKGVLQLEATFVDVKKHVSPTALEAGSLEYRSTSPSDMIK